MRFNTIEKNSHLLVIVLTVFVSLCSFQCTEIVVPVSPPADGEDEELTGNPVISLTSELLNYPLYAVDTGLPTEIQFSVSGLVDFGRVWTECDSDLHAEISGEYGEYIVSVYANESFSSHSTLILYAANGDKVTEKAISVVPAVLTLEKRDVNVSNASAGYIIRTDANVEYTCSSTVDWMDVSSDGHKIILNLSENTTNSLREGFVTVADKHKVFIEEIKVIQNREAVTLDKERTALIAIYNALGGDDWNDNRGWCTDAPLSEWTGVMTKKISGEEHVYYLHIRCQDAVGQIPEEIGDLEYITELWIIQEPGITGEIPQSIRNLKRVRDIRIAMTSVSGGIPECLKGMESLREISFYDNLLSGNLPAWLSEMPNLEVFDFSGNCFHGEIDSSLTKAAWWTTLSQNTFTPMGLCGLLAGQKDGYKLWLPGCQDKKYGFDESLLTEQQWEDNLKWMEAE